MVLCLYGFPSQVHALQFEWAWQHPLKSLAVKKAASALKPLRGSRGKVMLLYTMLNLPKWNNLDLTINFVSTKYLALTKKCSNLPPQMQVKVGPLEDLPCYGCSQSELCASEDCESEEMEEEDDGNSSNDDVPTQKSKAKQRQNLLECGKDSIAVGSNCFEAIGHAKEESTPSKMTKISVYELKKRDQSKARLKGPSCHAVCCGSPVEEKPSLSFGECKNSPFSSQINSSNNSKNSQLHLIKISDVRCNRSLAADFATSTFLPSPPSLEMSEAAAEPDITTSTEALLVNPISPDSHEENTLAARPNATEVLSKLCWTPSNGSEDSAERITAAFSSNECGDTVRSALNFSQFSPLWSPSPFQTPAGASRTPCLPQAVLDNRLDMNFLGKVSASPSASQCLTSPLCASKGNFALLQHLKSSDPISSSAVLIACTPEKGEQYEIIDLTDSPVVQS